MASKRYRRRKPSTHRRRSRKTSFKRKNAVNRVPYFKHKLVYISVPITNGLQTTGSFVKTICAQQPDGVNSNTNSYGFDNAPRWDVTARNYEKYAITGCKVQFIPSANTSTTIVNAGNSISSQQMPVWTWIDPDDVNVD